MRQEGRMRYLGRTPVVVQLRSALDRPTLMKGTVQRLAITKEYLSESWVRPC